MSKNNKNYYLFICVSLFSLNFMVKEALFPMDAGFQDCDQEDLRSVGKKRKINKQSENRSKNQKTQVLQLNLTQSNSCPSLFKKVVNECMHVQNEGGQEYVRVVDVWCERRYGYDFFYGKYQDSEDSLWFLDLSKSARVPVSAYKALDGADAWLQKILKKEFSAVYSCLEDGQDAIDACKKEAASHYKIHLMPLQKDLQKVIQKIIQKSIECFEFRSLIKNFKVLSDFIDLKAHSKKSKVLRALEQDNYYMAVIVIYCRDGKQYAQQLLDAVFDLFGNAEGLDITPRFNRRITSLIYYAQGNGDDKIIPGAERYFEEDFIHFKPDFTGEEVDYKLSF